MSNPQRGDETHDSWHRRAAIRIGAALRLLSRPARRNAQAGQSRDLKYTAIVTAAVVVVLMLLAATIDAPVARGARMLPEWITKLFDDITEYGKSGWFLWPLGLLLLAVAAAPERLPRRTQLVLTAIAVRAQFLFIAIALPGLVVAIVKRLIGRARPFFGGSLDPWLFDPFAWKAAYASFPSGHATTAVAAAVAISSLWPRTRTVMWIYALAIMASRVVITAHYPTDVLAGALAGAGGAILVRRYFARRGLGFSIGPDGAVAQFPLPSARRTKAVARGLLAE